MAPFLSSPRLYNGVRLVDHPAPGNVRRLDLGCLPLIEEMNRTGIALDVGALSKLEHTVYGRLEELEDRIRLEAGRPINPESGDQVAPFLFRELGLEPPGGIKLTRKTGRESTIDDVLCSIQDQHPVVPFILDHRELHKLLTTYIRALPRLISPDGRLRTTFSATRAVTGRLASSNPNLMNIPVRSELGRQIRAAFVASRPHTTLVSVDLSQVEMVWAAHLSQDPLMMDIFIRGDDIHTRTALAMFRLATAAVEDPNFKMIYRLPAKTLGFAILYGVTPMGLVLQIAAAGGPLWTTEQAEEHIQSWYDVYRKVYEWMQLQFARARRYQMVWDGFGRIRRIPEVKSVHRSTRNAGLREAGNQPIQASAQGTIKLAMAEVLPYIRQYQSYSDVVCWPLLQIHDELVFEVSLDIAEEFAEMVKSVMEGAVPLSIPVRAEYKIGDDWAQLK